MHLYWLYYHILKILTALKHHHFAHSINEFRFTGTQFQFNSGKSPVYPKKITVSGQAKNVCPCCCLNYVKVEFKK